MGPRKHPLTQKYGFFDFWGLFRGWRPVFWPELLLKSCLPTSKLLLGKIWDPILKISKKSPPRRKKYFFEKKFFRGFDLFFINFDPPTIVSSKKSHPGAIFSSRYRTSKSTHILGRKTVFGPNLWAPGPFLPPKWPIWPKNLCFLATLGQIWGSKNFFDPKILIFGQKKNFEKKKFFGPKIFLGGQILATLAKFLAIGQFLVIGQFLDNIMAKFGFLDPKNLPIPPYPYTDPYPY